MTANWRRRRAGVVVALALVGQARAAGAEAPRYYDLEGFGHFLDGNPESTAVSEEGAIMLPPAAREVFSDAAVAFSAAALRGNRVYAARVGDSKVVAFDAAGNVEEVFDAEGKLITAMLASGEQLFVAVSSPAKIYLVSTKHKAAVYYEPEAAYVWDMAEGPGGSLLVAAGEPGRLVKVTAATQGSVLFESDQTHLRSVAYNKKAGIFVGGGERGVVYRAADEKTFLALYDTSHTEVTSILASDSHVFIAGVSGANALVSEAPAREGKKGGKGPEVRSQLVQVALDGTAEVLAGSNDEAIFDMAFNAKGEVVVCTGATGRDDPRGRLYSVAPKNRLIAMLYQSPSRRITHLLARDKGALVAVASAGGRVVEVSGDVAGTGEFFTLPIDTGLNSQFGVLQVFGSWPKGTRVTAAVRVGQTAEPDATWSAWSVEMDAPGGQPVRVGSARYAQIRLTLHGAGSLSPEVYRVRLAYLRQNLPPFVREVVALRKGLALQALPVEEQKSKTISLTDKGGGSSSQKDDEEGRGKSMQRRARQIEEAGALTIRWVADDPNGDELRYDLEFRGQGERDWRPLEDDLGEPFYTFKSWQLPDGHYQFRVRATDAPSNPAGFERSDLRESRAVLVDNTAPSVDAIKVTVAERRAVARTAVADAVGPIVEAGYALDGGTFRPIAPDDGVLDGAGETFTLRLGPLQPGLHSLTIRVQDEAGNEGFGEAQFEVR